MKSLAALHCEPIKTGKNRIDRLLTGAGGIKVWMQISNEVGRHIQVKVQE
jgi:hypothetical protein